MTSFPRSRVGFAALLVLATAAACGDHGDPAAEAEHWRAKHAELVARKAADEARLAAQVAPLLERMKRSDARLAEAQERRERAQAENARLQAETERLREQLRRFGSWTTTTVRPDLWQPEHTGAVLGVDLHADTVSISLGSEDGVKVGFEYMISRGGSYLSTIEIERVEAHRSIGRELPMLRKGPIRKGDQVDSGG